MFKRFIFIFAFITLTLTACGTSEDVGNGSTEPNQDPVDSEVAEPGMIGYVVDKQEGRILVVESEAQDFSSTGGVSEFYNAIMFSNVPESIEIGEKVKVWFDIVAESYPGQSAATKIEVIQTEKPEGANLTEAEAIRKALASQEFPQFGVKVIKEVKFHKTEGIWTVLVKQEDQEFKIDVPDSVEEPPTSGKLPEIPIAQLTEELQNRIFQEIEIDNYEVKNFSSKAELIQYVSEVAVVDFATRLVDEFYEEKDGKLYIIPRGGLPFLLPDEPYEMTALAENEFLVEQVSENELHGKYKLTVTLIFDGDSWKYKDSYFEFL